MILAMIHSLGLVLLCTSLIGIAEASDVKMLCLGNPEAGDKKIIKAGIA